MAALFSALTANPPAAIAPMPTKETLTVGLQTPLYQKHVEAGARIVDFGGWDMPIQYQSLIEEHHAVRQHAGVFDVSHMTIVDVDGADAKAWLQYLLANDVEKLDVAGRALYSAMLNDEGGVVDDLIVYRRVTGYRLVVNCGTREKDLRWMNDRAQGWKVSISERPDLAILAVHGPESIDKVCELLAPALAASVRALGNFRSLESGDWFIARTGYTGERGLELLIPNAEAPALWDQLLQLGVKPIGLGARDTLRLEAGMNLYGHDMDESVSPSGCQHGADHRLGTCGAPVHWPPRRRTAQTRTTCRAAAHPDRSGDGRARRAARRLARGLRRQRRRARRHHHEWHIFPDIEAFHRLG
jgi:aminomethyltransferase